MKKIILLALLLPALAQASAPTFNLFNPGTSGQVEKSNGTYVLQAAAASDIYGLWSGTCSSTTFLRGDGACAAPSGTTGANPSASIGLSAVNGSATTFMRSDAAPALDESISPTMSGTWNFTNSSGLSVNNSSAPAWSGLSAINIGPYGAISSNNSIPDTYITSNAYYNGTNWIYEASGGTSLVNVGAAITLDYAASGSAGDTISFEPALSVGSTGSIVIANEGADQHQLEIDSANTASQETGDLVIQRPGSTANKFQEGPDVVLYDENTADSSVFQQSGGQTEIWQYNGSWNQDLYFDTAHALHVLGAVYLPGLASASSASDYVCINSSSELHYDSTNTCLVSSAEYKTDMHPLTGGLDEILKLHPISFKYNAKASVDDQALGTQVGFTAEAVAAVDPRIAAYDSAGKPRSVQYDHVSVILALAVQEQQAEIEHLWIAILLLSAWCIALTLRCCAR